MHASVLARPREEFPAEVRGLRLVAAAPDVWRVTARDGAVLGHIDRTIVDGSPRYRARRRSPGRTTLVELGEFWNGRDAVDVFR
ncbi:hypothetical protein ET445_11265 [Agromyces protaetiae]|uniref:DNA mismatch repair protein n=1 Tax=Agromyces protaetiae TaxID=2509455 RepID=A0A4P6FIM8_9MICO|nr:hypothetical protein [Agromyces protaetiae]QAY73837.1 hypothetical protein ET445_11265 [Agromyces protaetiae]